MPDDYIVAGTDFGYTDSYTISTSDTYSNCISGTSTFSEANLCALEELCKEFIDDNGNEIVPYSNYYWYLPAPLPPPPPHMPSFSNGDVIVPKQEFGDKEVGVPSISGFTGWVFQPFETYKVIGIEKGNYRIRVVNTTPKYNKDIGKDFSVNCDSADTRFKLLPQNEKSSNSYFPNLSHV